MCLSSRSLVCVCVCVFVCNVYFVLSILLSIYLSEMREIKKYIIIIFFFPQNSHGDPGDEHA